MEKMQAELIEILDKLEPPTSMDGVEDDPEEESKNNVEEKKGDQDEETMKRDKSMANLLANIDVTYDEEEVDKKDRNAINIDDEAVKDRWSRYIGAMGIEAVAKQAESTVFINGLGPLGIEIAKNIILAGCKELILHDTCSPTMTDIAGG
jgi:hypothetical protein